MVSFVLGHLEEDGQRPGYPKHARGQSKREDVRECVCARWAGKYTVPLIAKCVQVIHSV